jgi:hypothetical protein
MSPTLVDDLEQAIRQHLLASLPADPTGTLSSKNLPDLLIVYFTWRGRLIPARPRKVHESGALNASPKRSDHQSALESIVRKIERGDDLRSHLSRAVEVAFDPKGKKDRDLLIGDWGIHHLHLGTAVEADGFTKRTGDLLFAVFGPADAYLINIYEHGKWALRDIIEILVREWSGAGVLQEAKGIVGLSQQPTESEHLELREAGVALLVEVDGRVYFPPSLTTARTPLQATLRANQVSWRLQELRDMGEDLVVSLNKAAEGSAADGTWKPSIQNDVCFVESNRAAYVRIVDLR